MVVDVETGLGHFTGEKKRAASDHPRARLNASHDALFTELTGEFDFYRLVMAGLFFHKQLPIAIG